MSTVTDYQWQLEDKNVRSEAVKGGPGSGNWGHAGLPGVWGGSSPGGGLGQVCRATSGLGRQEGDGNAWLLDRRMDDASGTTSWNYADKEHRGRVKHKLVTELSETSGVTYAACNSIVKQWSYSSNDQDMRSLAIQRDAAKEFGEELSDFTKRRIKQKEAGCRGPDPYVSGCNPLYGSEVQRKVLRAQYDNTQKFLREQGIGPDDVVTLYRGAKWDKAITKDWEAGDKIAFHDNTLASWSLSQDVADLFVRRDSRKDGVLISVNVPAKMIFSTALTGVGCLTEGEVVVLGGRGTAELLDIRRANW